VCLQLMNVNGLSRNNVASHLQKHRLGLKRRRARARRTTQAAPASMWQTRSTADGTIVCSQPSPTALGSYALRGGIARRARASALLREWTDQEASNERELLIAQAKVGSCEAEDGTNGSHGGGYSATDDGAGVASDNRNLVAEAELVATELGAASAVGGSSFLRDAAARADVASSCPCEAAEVATAEGADSGARQVTHEEQVKQQHGNARSRDRAEAREGEREVIGDGSRNVSYS
jgi:hypothetical protein